MRYTSAKKLEVVAVTPPVDAGPAVAAREKARPRFSTHQALVAAVEGDAQVSAEDRRGGLLFVGGCSPGDLNVRRAQAILRMDRLASAWSHTAIILHWPEGAAANEIIGVEAALDPALDELQVPERNGVTFFTLDRYLDVSWYPNLAFAAVLVTKEKPAKAKRGKRAAAPENPITAADKDELEAAALDPMRERGRYPLWDWLGVWSRFAYVGRENPLAESLSHPGAAFCEYAYEAMHVDLTPGATAPNTCPETLWSTLLYWYEVFRGDGGNLRVWSSLAARDAASRTALTKNLANDFAARRGGKKQR